MLATLQVQGGMRDYQYDFSVAFEASYAIAVLGVWDLLGCSVDLGSQ